MVREQQSLSLYQTCAFALPSNADAVFFLGGGGVQNGQDSPKNTHIKKQLL